jgi:hypothetical protein
MDVQAFDIKLGFTSKTSKASHSSLSLFIVGQNILHLWLVMVAKIYRQINTSYLHAFAVSARNLKFLYFVK